MPIEITRAATELASKVKGALAGGAVGSVASVAGLDAIVLWFWNDLLHNFMTFLPTMPDNVATAIIALIGVLAGGWFTPDKLPDGTKAVTAGMPTQPTSITTPKGSA